MSELDEVTIESSSLKDLVSRRLGYESFSEANYDERQLVTAKLLQFRMLAGDLSAVSKNIQNDTLNPVQKQALTWLSEDEVFKQEFINTYANSFETDNESLAQGYQLDSVLADFATYMAEEEAKATVNMSVEDLISAQIDEMGDFKLNLEAIDTAGKLRERLGLNSQLGGVLGGKWRKDNPPQAIANWQCRIGASTFYIPPTSINVYQEHSPTSLGGAAIRQPNSPKMNLGHTQTSIMMTIYFPTHETIWGFDGDQPDWEFHNWDPASNVPQDVSYHNTESSGNIVSDRVVDTYLSSLRGLITQFKYMPFLPVQNTYLNRVHDIDAVVMKNMTISTVEGFPLVAAVTLEMSKFNYDPFMPMIGHFDQAIHWGKFRQMAARCAAALEARVNRGFLVGQETIVWDADNKKSNDGRSQNEVLYDGELTPALDKGRDISDGRYFDIYFPESTPGTLFAADTTDFRQPGEDEYFSRTYWDFIIGDLGFQSVDAPDFNFFDYDEKRKIFTNERELLMSWLANNELVYEAMSTDKFEEFVVEAIAEAETNGSVNPANKAAFEARLRNEWFYVLFDKILTEDPVFKKLKESKEAQDYDYRIKEWEVPMRRLALDWSKIIVNGVAVSMSNRYASLQIQLQDEPTYQHIGGGDSNVEVEMTVIGEENLINLRRTFQHINGLARLERAHGTLGFLGIKNVFTSLCGIKYVLPVSFEVETMPGYPGAYKVRMALVDFDVMQGKREDLDSSQQEELIDLYGKRNPFLRIKQSWGATNCYPDFPLDVRDDENKVIGHLDPDWYFRSFVKDNTDLLEWGLDKEAISLIQQYTDIKLGNTYVDAGIRALKLAEIREQLKALSESRAGLPGGWEIDENGDIINLEDDNLYNPDKREYRYYLGAYGENQENIAVLDMFSGGVFALGQQNADTEEVEYVTGFSVFSEDNASRNLANVPALEGTTPLPNYQQEYMDGSYNPNDQYQRMMKDWDYRNIDGRMVKAFPTYMLWLIDEGGRFAGIKLFDNLYGLNSIIDFSVSQSADDPISDTLILRLSNIYEKLTRSYTETLIDPDDVLADTPIGRAISTTESRARNIKSGLFDTLQKIDNIRLKPGVRVHLRAGWGNNPNALQTIFNGTITEVQAGEIVTVVAQTDAVELSSFVNAESKNGHSGKLDGALNNFWVSEPRDLMVRLLSMGSSHFREWLAWGSKGVFFSESRYGIRHFGNILYEPMTTSEVEGSYNKQVSAHVNSSGNNNTSGSNFVPLIGAELTKELSELDSVTDFLPTSSLAGTMASLAQALWTNSFAKRDYEIYKRNIYPGNGTGIAQYMGGDLIDAGIMVTQAGTVYDSDSAAEAEITGTGGRTTPGFNPGAEPPLGGANPNSPNSSGGGVSWNPFENILNVDNEEVITELWEDYFKEAGLTQEEIIEILESPSQGNTDIELEDGQGWLNSLLGWGTNTVNNGIDVLDAANPFNLLPVDLPQILKPTFNPLSLTRNYFEAASGVANGLIRFGASPIGQVLGLSQIIRDDDIQGFDEVSFRAQTYMKTVWDLFEVCAALLPNYIVAVRPFEERSTVFYGKPHWLYTSGVIPVTTGVQSDLQSKPGLINPDQTITAALSVANNSSLKVERLIETARNSSELKDINEFLLANVDPYDVSSVDTALFDEDVVNLALASTAEEAGDQGLELDLYEPFRNLDPSTLTEGEITELGELLEAPGSDGTPLGGLTDDFVDSLVDFRNTLTDGDQENIQSDYDQVVQDFIEMKQDQNNEGAGGIHDADKLAREILSDSRLSATEKIDLTRLLVTDPITFSYQFGWRFSRATVWIGPEAGVGYDTYGELARQRYDEDFSESVDVIGGNSGRTLAEARDIWYDFRRVYRYRPEVQSIFLEAFPFGQDNYDALMDTFMRFLWQDPFNRAWVVLRADRHAAGLIDTADSDYYNEMTDIFGESVSVKEDGINKWFFDGIDGAWDTFLKSADVTVDGSGVPVSGSTKAWMRRNSQEGKSARFVTSAPLESISDWYDENIGQVLGLVLDSVTGLIASIRLSLAQLSAGLDLAGQMQLQSNVLNALLNDSIYYQLGNSEQDLLRLVDNPFTREYGEPVVEIREPFQRVHHVNSIKDILGNQISESLTEVATVVTAVSDGKNPVTVHFDKGVAPDRQIETTVETGIYWDNAYGSGFFGFLQPLLHPLETIRGTKKLLEGSSDQLSARKIALYHLKNNLKNIYQGELILMGNTDIRPHDLLFIADNYEKIFGMVEVGQVIHHFTPETGFVTSVTPNALVTVNDPGRWTMLSYLGNRFTNHMMRDEMRALMEIGTDRFVTQGLEVLESEDLMTQFSDHIEGAVQWTQGSTGLVRDLGAMFAGGGIQGLTERDRQATKILQLDIGLGIAKAAAPIPGALAGALIGTATASPGVGTVGGGIVGAAAGYAVADLAWDAWNWVKNNLLDQHGCYISFLNKHGQPMDAGLSYFQGSAVGANHTLSLFPTVFGLPVTSPRVEVKQDGHFRITTNELLSSLGWTEVETLALYRDTSLFVNETNKNILDLAGRGADGGFVTNNDYNVFYAEVLEPDGEYIDSLDRNVNGVEDGDTIWVKVLDSNGSGFANGRVLNVRLTTVNTYELQYKNNPYTDFNETVNNAPDDLGRLAREYVSSKFLVDGPNRNVAIRVKKSETNDKYGRVLGTIFHNAPVYSNLSNRKEILLGYASASPPIPTQAFLDDGRPHTLNWELVMVGYGNVDMRESLWNTSWRDQALDES